MFRFTIRELVLLTLVVAVTMAWLADHRFQAKLNSKMQAAVRSQAKANLQMEAKLDNWRYRAESLKEHIEFFDDKPVKWSDTNTTISIGGDLGIIVDP